MHKIFCRIDEMLLLIANPKTNHQNGFALIYWNQNKKRLTVCVILLLLFLFVDSTNLDVFIARNTILHVDDAEDARSLLSIGGDSGNRQGLLFSCFEPLNNDKPSLKIIYDKDSPSSHVHLTKFANIPGFVNDDGDSYSPYTFLPSVHFQRNTPLIN